MMISYQYVIFLSIFLTSVVFCIIVVVSNKMRSLQYRKEAFSFHSVLFSSKKILTLLIVSCVLSTLLILEITPAGDFNQDYQNQDTRVFTVANYDNSTDVASIKGQHNLLLDQRYCIVFSDAIYYNPLEDGFPSINSSWVLNYSLKVFLIGNATILMRFYVYNIDREFLGESHIIVKSSIHEGSVSDSITRNTTDILDYYCLAGAEYNTRLAFISILSGNSEVSDIDSANPATLRLISASI